jgi:transcriptional regulator with XRE-family HTH domain
VDVIEFAKRVRERKDELRLSNATLASRAGVSTSMVAKLLGERPHNMPERPTAIGLARALRWNPDEVLGWLGHDSLTDAEHAALTEAASSTAQQLKTMLRIWCKLPQADQDIVLEVMMVLESRGLTRRGRGVTLFEPDPSVSPAGPQNCVRG